MQSAIARLERPEFSSVFTDAPDYEALCESVRITDNDLLTIMEIVDQYLDENRHYSNPDESPEIVEEKDWALQDIRSHTMSMRLLTHSSLTELNKKQPMRYTRQLAEQFNELSLCMSAFCMLECPDQLEQLESKIA